MNKEEIIQLVITRVLDVIKEKECDNSQALHTNFQTSCCVELDLNREDDCIGECNKSATQCIYIKNLSLNALAEIALGLTSKPATALVRNALLQGKKVYTTEEQIELYTYTKSTNAQYYTLFEEYLQLFKASGLVIARDKDELHALLGNETQTYNIHSSSKSATQMYEKKVLTEKDVVAHKSANGSKELFIKEKTIVTDLAKEYAQKHSIKIIPCEK